MQAVARTVHLNQIDRVKIIVVYIRKSLDEILLNKYQKKHKYQFQ